MIVFETKRLLVKLYTEQDIDHFFSLNGDPVVMQYIRAAKTRVESDIFFRQVMSEARLTPHRGRWAVWEKATGNFVGSFAIIPVPSMPGKLQLGYSLTPANWGKGFATELTVAGLKYFRVHHQLPEIYGITEIPNLASQNVLLKAGFSPAGIMKEDDKDLYVFKAPRSLPE